MQENDADKRRAPRFSAHVRVLYFSKGQPRAVDVDCQNISAEGLFVKTRRRGPDTGTPVSLILNFDGSEKEIMIDGIVRWQGEVQALDDGTEAAGMSGDISICEVTFNAACSTGPITSYSWEIDVDNFLGK